MYKTFVLINCELGRESKVIEQLRRIENVVETQGTYGVNDIVARIESDSQSQFDHIISDQIRKINDVNSTLTLIPTEKNEWLPDLIPDIIPEQKKPLKEPSSENDEDLEDDDYEDDYDE